MTSNELIFAQQARGYHFRVQASEYTKAGDYPDAVALKVNGRRRMAPHIVMAFKTEVEQTEFLTKNRGARKL